jgi:4-hydroxymandelate oxidase
VIAGESERPMRGMMTTSLSLRELEAEARLHLDARVYDFYAGGADDETTVRANETAFAAIGLVPRVLRPIARHAVDVTLMGAHASMPIVIAPTAFHRLAHPDGERATARAAARAGTIMIVSMASTVAIEEIAAAAREAAPGRDAAAGEAAAGEAAAGRDAVEGSGPQLWFQLYIQPDLGFTEAIIRRAEAAGCTALVVSVDSAAFGRRERDLRNGFLDLPPGMCCENMRLLPGDGEAGPARPFVFSPELSWQHIDWLRNVTALKLALKGVAHPDDARLAAEHGIDALVVSNHGGRQLDTMPAAIELLPAVVDAVDGRMPLLLDGGVRRGTDIVKAVALGASAVAIGRPVLWGLAVAGETGVAQALEMLRSELHRTLSLCGCGSLQDVTRDLVRVRRIDAWR